MTASSKPFYYRRHGRACSAITDFCRGWAHQRMGRHTSRGVTASVARLSGRGFGAAAGIAKGLAGRSQRARRYYNRQRVRSDLPRICCGWAGGHSCSPQRTNRESRPETSRRFGGFYRAFGLVHWRFQSIHDGNARRLRDRSHGQRSPGALWNLRLCDVRGCAGRPIAHAHQALLLGSVPNARTGSSTQSANSGLIRPLQISAVSASA